MPRKTVCSASAQNVLDIMPGHIYFLLLQTVDWLRWPIRLTKEPIMNIKGKVAVITGAAGGIGRAVAYEFANRQVGSVALVDKTEAVHDLAKEINQSVGRTVATGYPGDVTDENFRSYVYQD